MQEMIAKMQAQMQKHGDGEGDVWKDGSEWDPFATLAILLFISWPQVSLSSAREFYFVATN